ncbi:MAG: helix-turn-helix transcriptional regulator [Clostridia bacterium]|nr:helix-turn-helix transcriptional regulator [Clostridia bacterium]
MAVTYKKLWHLLIDRNLMKKDLEELSGITHYQMCKLARDKDVTTDVLGAICQALNVRVEDIMDFVPDEK